MYMRLCFKDSGACLILVPVQLPLVVRITDGCVLTDRLQLCVCVCVQTEALSTAFPMSRTGAELGWDEASGPTLPLSNQSIIHYKTTAFRHALRQKNAALN